MACRITSSFGRALRSGVPSRREARGGRSHTIERRTTRFRNLVVAVVVAAGAVVRSAVVARSTRLLAGLMLPVPLCGAFLVTTRGCCADGAPGCWRNGPPASWFDTDT